MYRTFIRPILFLLSPENIHGLVKVLLKTFFFIPGISFIIKSLYSADTTKAYTISGLNFSNRVGLAAGFDKNADLYKEMAVFGFGFVESLYAI